MKDAVKPDDNPLIQCLIDEARILYAASVLEDGRTTHARNLKRWASMMALAATDLRAAAMRPRR